MFVFEDTIVGEKDPAVCLLFLRGRVECSLDEWEWCMEILHPPDEEDELPS
jgi:hypothetical protein